MTNKKSFWKIVPCAGLVLLLAWSCTASYEEYNTNRNEKTELEMEPYDELLGSAFSQMMRNVVLFRDGINLDSDYQVAQGLTADLYSGYLAPTGSWYGGAHTGAYVFIPGWIERTLSSGMLGIMTPWKRIMDKGGYRTEVVALANVVKVEGMHRVTDAYGPIPYSKFGTTTTPEYDSQEDVYRSFFADLDNAIDVLTTLVSTNPSAKLMEDFDYIYKGDVTNWIKFANSLRLRLALRVVYADAELAAEEGVKSLTHPMGFITDQNNRASLKHDMITYYHPLHEIANAFNEGEVRMGATMDCYLNGYADPRLPVYFTQATQINKTGTAANYRYCGVRMGIITTSWDVFKGPAVSNLNINRNTAEIVWMTAAEPYFLQAEAALRGWNGGTDAQARSFYEAGITASFNENGLSGASTYYSNTTSAPIAFTDNLPTNGNANAPSSRRIGWTYSRDNTDEAKLEKIITQKWIAMYPDGPEGWAEFRRTGYPRLLPVMNNRSNGLVNTNTQVTRLPYPQSEYNSNAAGVASGVAALSGPDTGGTKLWWDAQ